MLHPIYQILFRSFPAALILFGCCDNQFVPTRDFDLTLRITNPVRSFKVNLGIRIHPSDSSRTILFIRRMNLPDQALDYHDPYTWRKNITDSVILDPKKSQELFCRIGRLKDLQSKIPNPELNAHFYSLIIKDRDFTLENRSFSGDKSDADEIVRFLMDLFETHYPVVRVQDTQSEVFLKREDQTNSATYILKQDCRNFVFEKYGKTCPLSDRDFVRVWNVIETNQGWSLKTDTSFGKSSLRYSFRATHGQQTAEWKVYAPHLIADKRYYSIINVMETLEFESVHE